MHTKFWMIIKDDTKRTFEVCGHASNDNAFHNKTVAMQRVGMNVSCNTPPVTNKTSSKDLVQLTGYTKEDGLLDRLTKEFAAITLKSSFEDEWQVE